MSLSDSDKLLNKEDISKELKAIETLKELWNWDLSKGSQAIIDLTKTINDLTDKIDKILSNVEKLLNVDLLVNPISEDELDIKLDDSNIDIPIVSESKKEDFDSKTASWKNNIEKKKGFFTRYKENKKRKKEEQKKDQEKIEEELRNELIKEIKEKLEFIKKLKLKIKNWFFSLILSKLKLKNKIESVIVNVDWIPLNDNIFDSKFNEAERSVKKLSTLIDWLSKDEDYEQFLNPKIDRESSIINLKRVLFKITIIITEQNKLMQLFDNVKYKESQVISNINAIEQKKQTNIDNETEQIKSIINTQDSLKLEQDRLISYLNDSDNSEYESEIKKLDNELNNIQIDIDNINLTDRYIVLLKCEKIKKSQKEIQKKQKAILKKIKYFDKQVDKEKKNPENIKKQEEKENTKLYEIEAKKIVEELKQWIINNLLSL